MNGHPIHQTHHEIVKRRGPPKVTCAASST
jgi:hypothetical protein